MDAGEPRVLIVGAVRFTEFCLRVLVEFRINIVAILNPLRADVPHNADYVDLAPAAGELKIPLIRFRRISEPTTITTIAALRPDVVFVLGLSQLLPAGLLSLPRLGCIGSHPSLLPRDRGRHPLIWALADGYTESGLSFLMLDDGVDTGDIIWQGKCRIDPDDDAGVLYGKVESLAREGLWDIVGQLRAGHVMGRSQDHQAATVRTKRTQADGVIDWRLGTETIRNLIRALALPYSGAETTHEGARLIVWSACQTGRPKGEEESARPGTVLEVSSCGVRVRTGDGALMLTRVEGTGEKALISGVVLGGGA